MLAGFAACVEQKWAWAKQNSLFWANLGLTGATLLLIFVFPGPTTEAGPSDLRLRLWSMILQLLGAITVWLDLTSTARAFGKGGSLKSTVAWLRAFSKGASVTIHATTGGATFTGGACSACQRRRFSTEATLEERVATLEYNLATIDKDLAATMARITDGDRRLQDQIKEETQKREASHKRLEAHLQDAIVGNYTTLAFGAAWVFVGIVLSALAPEIARVVAGQWAAVWAAL